MIDVERLHAYVDGQLEGTELAEVEKAVGSDPQLEDQVHSIREVKRCVESHVKPVPSDEAWRACVGRLNELDKVRRTESFVSRYAFSMCAVLFALIVGVGLFNRTGDGRVDPGAVWMQGAGLSPMSLPADVNSWLRSRNSSAQIPENLIRVVGTAEGVVGGNYMARANLRDSQGDMALFLVSGVKSIDNVAPMDDGVHMACQVGQDNCVIWPSGEAGQVLMLVGPRDHDELRAVADAIRAAAR